MGAQYDSEVVYHSLKEELSEKGVIFEDMSVAIRDHEDMVRKHFMQRPQFNGPSPLETW